MFVFASESRPGRIAIVSPTTLSFCFVEISRKLASSGSTLQVDACEELLIRGDYTKVRCGAFCRGTGGAASVLALGMSSGQINFATSTGEVALVHGVKPQRAIAISWDPSTTNWLAVASPVSLRMLDVAYERITSENPVVESVVHNHRIACLDYIRSRARSELVLGLTPSGGIGAFLVFDPRQVSDLSRLPRAVSSGSKKTIASEFVACHPTLPQYVVTAGNSTEPRSRGEAVVQLWDLRNTSQFVALNQCLPEVEQLLWISSDTLAVRSADGTLGAFEYPMASMEGFRDVTTPLGSRGLGHSSSRGSLPSNARPAEYIAIHTAYPMKGVVPLLPLPGDDSPENAKAIPKNPGVLGITKSGELSAASVQRPPHIAWSSPSTLLASFDVLTVAVESRPTSVQLLSNLSSRLEMRLKNGFALDPEINQFCEPDETTQQMFTLFRYISVMQKLGFQSVIPGLIKLESVVAPGETVGPRASTPHAAPILTPYQMNILTFAGWTVEFEITKLPGFTEKEMRCRAIAIAIFMRNYNRAIELVVAEGKCAPKEEVASFDFFAFLLREFKRMESMRHHTELAPSLGLDPNVKALCTALINQWDGWLSIAINFLETARQPLDLRCGVFQDRRIPLIDRIAIAVLYLTRDERNQLLQQYHAGCRRDMRCDTFVFSGLGDEGAKEMQQYVDFTGDVQLAACLFAPVRSAKVRSLWKNWREAYTGCLNNWGYFMERAQFDVAVKRAELQWEQRHSANNGKGNAATTTQHLPGVTLRCVCGQQLQEGAPPLVRPKPNAVLHVASRCRNPECIWPSFPLCSVCLGEMESSGTSTAPTMWFSWCSGCQHGGHLQHLQDWFDRHTVCPADGCNCQCKIE